MVARYALVVAVLLGVVTACQEGTDVVVRSDLAMQESGSRMADGSSSYGTIFGDIVPQTAVWPDTRPVTVGVKFKSSIDGKISGVRVYRGVTNAPFLKVSLWTESGTLLAEGTLAAGTAGLPGNAWIEIPFTAGDGVTKVDVPIKANTVYVASYHSPTGEYAALNEGLANETTNANAFGGTLTALGGTTNGGNGVYLYDSPNGFPNQSFRNTNYFVDVLFSTNATILGNSVPTVQSWPDANPVTVGLKFKSSLAGNIAGVRFYRGAPNNGPYRVALWTEAGELLAEATLDPGGDTLPGNTWVEVPFVAKVPIQANTVYVASYYCATGQYAALNEGLDNDIVTTNAYGGTLTALGGLTNGGNGVYKYAVNSTSLLTDFPSSSYRNTNYYVDVLFDSH